MHDRKIMVRYVAEMTGAFLIYALVLVISIDVGRPMHGGLERTLVLASPMLPVLLVVWAIVRQFRRSDEYIRLKTLESIAIAAAMTAGWTFSYGFLENAGYPRLSMFTVWPVMGFVWALVSLFQCATRR